MEATCMVTGEKSNRKLIVGSKIHPIPCEHTIENFFIKYETNTLDDEISVHGKLEHQPEKIAEKYGFDNNEKIKLAGKLANFSIEYAFDKRITYNTRKTDNYPTYGELIDENFLNNLKQEPIPNLDQRIKSFLFCLENKKIIEPAIGDWEEEYELENQTSQERFHSREEFNDGLNKLELFYCAISYTEKERWQQFQKHLKDKNFIDDYQITIEGQEFLKKKSNNKKIKNNSIENVKNISNIRPPTQERISVIEEDYQLNIKHRKINNLFGELKKIEVNNFPNASALLLRAFLELSINFYISEKNLELRSNNISLIGKIQKIIEHIGLTPTEKEPLTAIIANPNNPAHTQILNSYTHNKDHHPDPISIKTAFDNLSILFKKIYSE